MRFFTSVLLAGSLLALLPLSAQAQNAGGRRFSWFAQPAPGAPFQRFFFYWGYNRATFAPSDIHFSGPEYDFTLFDVEAKDRPTKFSFKTYFGPTTLSIPQYDYRLGFYLTRHFAVSVGVDHLKYVLTNGQTVLMSGVISEKVSKRYAGTYLQRPIRVTEDFVRFEHTDGLNLVNLDLEYHLPIVQLAHSNVALQFHTGIGGIWVVPRTDAHVFGYGLNNHFHLSGYSLAGKAGLRLYVIKRLFLMAETKVGYITLPDILLRNGQPERANQNIFFWEKMGAVGFDFNFSRRGHRNR
ncbi:MAG: hypothetical protein ABIO24_00035 [Saprospiraceae bacterium]